MQLETLTCGDTQRAIGITPSQFILGKVLIGGHYAARDTRTYHKLVCFLRASGFTLLTSVAILLLVHTMELDELYLVFREARGVLFQFLSYVTTQVVALNFDTLDLTPHPFPESSQVILRVFVFGHTTFPPKKYLRFV